MSKTDALKPTTEEGGSFHIGIKPGDLARGCLLVGHPGRARKIAREIFVNAHQVGFADSDDRSRCLRSYTGTVQGMPISVVTTAMGCPSQGIVLSEAADCGARWFIRVGSCATFHDTDQIGDSAIFTGAVRLDGADRNWAPVEFPAVADFRVVSALVNAAGELGLPFHTGIGMTTDCFNEGQGRPDCNGYLPPRLKEMVDELVQRGVRFASMEEAGLFIWTLAHNGGNGDPKYWAGAIDAIICNRKTGVLEHRGEMGAARIAIRALQLLDRKYPLITPQP